MTVERERPQYGEYASVDEQIAAGGVAVEPVALPTVTPVAPTVAPGFAPSLARTRIPGEEPASRSWDVALTMTLLVLGALSVFTGIPQQLDFAEYLKQAYVTAGVGVYTNVAAANAIGAAIVISQIVLYVVTALVTVLRLRARKLSFFVPLIGAAVSGIIVLILVLVAMMSDPAFAAWIHSQS